MSLKLDFAVAAVSLNHFSSRGASIKGAKAGEPQYEVKRLSEYRATLKAVSAPGLDDTSFQVNFGEQEVRVGQVFEVSIDEKAEPKKAKGKKGDE